ncbi:MAG: hypothetical protein PHC53_02965 [Patescibacteria group bacterium]|nr:hypothetical protein [Patescibacteria group bacterium]
MLPGEPQFGLNPFNPEEEVSASSYEKDEHESASAHSFEILNNPEGREVLLSRIDDLIRGVRLKKTDTVIFLDKSARPLAWLFNERYKRIFPGETIPAIRFINIGPKPIEEDWRSAIEYQDDQFGVFSEKELKRKLMIQSEVPTKQERYDAYIQRVHELQRIFGSRFLGKRITLVDEIVHTGNSLERASELFGRAFPNLKRIRTAALFDQDEVSSNFPSNEDLMPWFKNPGLIGVFDIFNDQALLAKRVDKNAVEEAKKKILREKGLSLEDLKIFIEENGVEIRKYFGIVRSSLRMTTKNEHFWRDLEWIEEMMFVTMDESSTEEALRNWAINVIQQIPAAVLFLKKYEEHLINEGQKVQFAPVTQLLMILREKADRAYEAIRLNGEISGIESRLGDARRLRKELSVLASQEN